MYALLREREMKRCCSKTDVFKHCEVDSGSAVRTGLGWVVCAPPTFLEIAFVTKENNAARKNFLCHAPPPRYNFLPTVVSGVCMNRIYLAEFMLHIKLSPYFSIVQ